MDAILEIALLPQPRRVRPLGGRTYLNAESDAHIDVSDPRVAAEWERLRRLFPPARANSSDSAKVFVLESSDAGGKDAYHLEVTPQLVRIKGGSAAGCFYGLQTLAQLIASDHDDSDGDFAPLHRTSSIPGIPCCHIEDYPSFATRGLLHDVTRGKVPKLSTLKLIADRLARLKCNQLQLYIEHAFAFSFDPQICKPEDGLTPDEVRELDVYCRERFIDLVPAVATLGHMGRILSMPRYRHLAEIELTTPWEQMTWLQRLKGATLDVLNPESRRLVERIWTDILAAFSSPVVNICGDEPWDLGKGKNARLSGLEGSEFPVGHPTGHPSPLAKGGRSGVESSPLAKGGSRGVEPAASGNKCASPETAEAYVDHLRWTADLVARHGRTFQIWGDVIRNHTDLLTRLPSDMTILHWGYDDRTDYEGTAAFTRAGYPTCVCPGTSGWKRILNAMDLAEVNIATFAQAGARHGATGLVNTDWGDFGHFNQLACSWHGIALGAAFAWNADHVSGIEFDRLFARHVLPCPPQLITHLRAASAIAEKCETWRALITPLEEFTANQNANNRVPSNKELEQAAVAAVHSKSILEKCTASDVHDEELSRDFRELHAACQFTELLINRSGQFNNDDEESACQTKGREAAVSYSACWLARNKESGLGEIRQALR